MSKTANTTSLVATKKTKSAGQKSTVKVKKIPLRKVSIIKQCMALDIAKDDIQICFREAMSDGVMRIKTQKKVNNTKTGWNIIATEI